MIGYYAKSTMLYDIFDGESGVDIEFKNYEVNKTYAVKKGGFFIRSFESISKYSAFTLEVIYKVEYHLSDIIHSASSHDYSVVKKMKIIEKL